MKSNSPELLEDLTAALDRREFIAYFQPQYNMTTGLMVGAEALARWKHPEMGMIPPGMFVPAMEENNLISRLDLSIVEQVCKFLKTCRDEGSHLVPVSVNLSRQELYQPGFVEQLEQIRKQYEIPVDLLRVEIVESVALGGVDQAKKMIRHLHELGYVVELDDFGSGYSSLNILKDINYDVLKLDMAFMTDDTEGRGGTIISSVVRMAKWLMMPVIAEGVETKKQADFLKSVGCDYAQGYLFARPMPEEDFHALLADSTGVGLTTPALKVKETVNPVSFWNDESLETLIFNRYVGGAAVFSYHKDGSVEYLRVNEKYITELRMNTTTEEILKSDFWSSMDEENQKIYRKMLERAIDTEEEQECETWRNMQSTCCGVEKLCIRSNVVLIGKSEDEFIFYESIRNITAEKQLVERGQGYERQFKNVTEQANIYYWEYNVATKEMRPCFRCMRDLGLPPLVRNYPEPAIEQGIFPQDYADMYRDWHKQIANGVEHLEAVIPLTVGRVPFHVRYTTEFDELGRPVKAYGSATLVTEEEKSKAEGKKEN